LLKRKDQLALLRHFGLGSRAGAKVHPEATEPRKNAACIRPLILSPDVTVARGRGDSRESIGGLRLFSERYGRFGLVIVRRLAPPGHLLSLQAYSRPPAFAQ
jgi:hypothetical protein